MNTRFAAAASTAALLALTACSGSSSSEELTWEDSPLQEVYTSLWGDTERPEEELNQEEEERQRRAEEIIAACMAEEGFDYTPAVYGGSTSYGSTDEDWGSEEWTQQYGYGITTDPWAEEWEEQEADVEEWTDPNADYIASMSEMEQEAYYEALYGPMTAMTEEEMLAYEESIELGEEDYGLEYTWEDAGCQGRADYEVYESAYEEENDMWEDPAVVELFDAMDAIYEEVERDERVSELNAEWVQCMEDAGHTGFAQPMDAENSIWDEYERIQESANEEVDWESIDWEAMEEGELDVDPTEDLYQNALEAAGLQELREREIELAVADKACRSDLNLDSRVLEVQFEYEKTFLEEHQAEIDAVLATYGQES
ncbi:hypothetical protein [Nesterenkonia flava]|uniref:Uncharacterized protein n=1 Tax=Nesterenkonia flava TaxID=469799 RepID=A0ABU1FVN4_9MICC|nr:hypothetical protein [Nesterenkonia flava]MDR5712735.1 hypothetical protein [Nesterenkonia flava]